MLLGLSSVGTGELLHTQHGKLLIEDLDSKGHHRRVQPGCCCVTTLTFTEAVLYHLTAVTNERDTTLQVMDLEPLDARERDEAARNFSFNEYNMSSE